MEDDYRYVLTDKGWILAVLLDYLDFDEAGEAADRVCDALDKAGYYILPKDQCTFVDEEPPKRPKSINKRRPPDKN